MKLSELPRIVYSMETRFSEAEIRDRLRAETRASNEKVNEQDLALTIDLYLTNLVRHGILQQHGSFFEFRHINPRRT